MAKIWTDQEIQIFEQLLVDGVRIYDIQQYIKRTEGAISARANTHGFSTKTENGVKRLYDYSKTPSMHELDRKANNNAIVMLNNLDITITPEDISTLSTHILNTQGQYND